jgi:DnaJ like chaperone protein
MNEMRLSNEQKTRAKRLYNEGKQSDFKLDLILNQLVTACRDNKELLKLFVDIQYRAAQVDGLSAKKIKALDIIFSRLGFVPLHKQYRFYEDFDYQETHQQQKQGQNSSYQRYSRKAPNELDKAFAILEITPDATKQDVKRAYRRLLNKNHPDKLIAQGLPEEMIKIANDKTQKIVKAYELICKTKGW